MKRFIIVGLGNFGSSVAEALYARGHEVVAVDANEMAVDRLSARVSRAAVGDARQRETLERVGARGADAGIVSTGDDITASILATMALRDLDVADVYVKVISRDHARVMARLGVTETVFPERESALNLGARLCADSVFNYVRLTDGYSMQEMDVPDDWEGSTLVDLQLRRRYKISVVAIHDVLSGAMQIPPDPYAVLKDSDTLLVAGPDAELERLAKIGYE